MKHSYFFDENQLEKWVLAAENIRDDFGLEKGVVEHSIETEINDSLVFGDMMKYFDCFPDNPLRDDDKS